MFSAPSYKNGYESSAGKKYLRRLHSLTVSSKTQNLFISFYTETLPAKTCLENNCFYLLIATNCHFCGERETLPHVFLDCKGDFCFWAFFAIFLMYLWSKLRISQVFVLFWGTDSGVWEFVGCDGVPRVVVVPDTACEAAHVRKTAWQLFWETPECTLSAASTAPYDVNQAQLKIK